MNNRTGHPLDRLHEARDFAEATVIYEAAARHEAYAPWADAADRAHWGALVDRARAARRIAATHAPESAARALRGFGMEEFAAALETGDWRKLEF